MNSIDNDDTHYEMNSRSPLEWADRRNIRPKRMRVDASVNHNASPAMEDRFEFNPDAFLHSLWFPRFHRPLPALTNILSATSTGSRKGNKNITDIDTDEYTAHNLPPFIQEYFDRVNCCKSEDINNNQNIDFSLESNGDILEVYDSQDSITSPNLQRNSDQSTVQDVAPLFLERTSTLLTQGHHKRLIAYLSELDQGDRLNSLRFKEKIQKLCLLLGEERMQYLQALQEYRVAHMDRFLLGFKGDDALSSLLVRTYPEVFVQFYKQLWHKSDWKKHTHFGILSTQAIALQSFASKIEENSFHVTFTDSIFNELEINMTKSSSGSGTSDKADYERGTASRVQQDSNNEEYKIFHEALVSPNIVHASTDHNTLRLEETLLDSCLTPGTVILPQSAVPLVCLDQSYCFLSDDLKAKDLAYEYGVDVIMTARAMEYLLQRPGYSTTQWNVPISYVDMSSASITNFRRKQSNRIVIIEDPIPQSLTPRQCLNFGVSDAIVKQITQSKPSSDDLEKAEDNLSSQVVFSLLNFPAIGKTTKPIKILVRSYNHILDEQGKPIRIYSHLEYFVDRGLEEQTSHERSVLMMEKMLQPDGRVFLCRIDVQNMKVVLTEEVTSAQLIVGHNKKESWSSRTFLPLDKDERVHFQSFTFLLHGIMKNSCPGKYLLCIPSRDASVSLPLTTATVHKSISPAEANTSDINNFIDIGKELDKATEVSLGRKSLFNCFRLWTWTHEKNKCIPYTFKPQN